MCTRVFACVLFLRKFVFVFVRAHVRVACVRVYVCLRLCFGFSVYTYVCSAMYGFVLMFAREFFYLSQRSIHCVDVYTVVLANEKNAIQRHLVTIEFEALLMAMMMSALCKHTHKHTHVLGFI